MSIQGRFLVKNGVDNNLNTIINLANPLAAQDAATKIYVDSVSKAYIDSISNALATLQLSRTTTLSLSTTDTAVTFNVIDISNQIAVISRDVSITSQINITQDGLYFFSFIAETINTTTTNSDIYHIVLNGISEIPGSLSTVTSRSSRAVVSCSCVVVLTAGQYVSVYAKSSAGTTGTMQIGASFIGFRLNGIKGDAGAAGGTNNFQYTAAAFDNPNNTGWAINALAPVFQDPANTSLQVRSFDDTLSEGIGFSIYISPSALNITFTFNYRAATSPTSNKGVILQLYSKLISINTTAAAWSSPVIFNTANINANNYFTQLTQTYTLAALGIVPGNTYQFEIVRNGSSLSDTLVGDFYLLNSLISLS